LFNLFGPGETNPHVLPEIIKQLRASNTLRLGNISPKRDFVFVVDAAEALISLTEVATSGSVVNVGTGHSYSVEELLANVAQITGLELKIERDPERWRASDRPNLQSDPSALRALLPGALATDLADGLKALIASELDA
jgi:UDP-glucose 4-epimerase